MRLQGQRVKRERWLTGDRYAVRLEVEAVIPMDDLSEACFEHETIEWLRRVQQHLDTEDLAWLRCHGDVYVRENEPTGRTGTD